MGLFFGRKKKAKMEIPPPPPPEEGGAKVWEAKAPAMPAPAGAHLPSDMPEIKPVEKAAPLPEFPEIPEEMYEEHAPRPAMPAVKAPSHAAPLKPEQRFVSISNFQAVITRSDEIRASLKEAESLIARLNALRNEEDQEFQKWRSHLEGVQKKLDYIDQSIFKGA